MSDAGERIEVQVESLEFDGVDVREPARVQAAFVAELTRLLVEQGVPERLASGSSDRRPDAELDGGSLHERDLRDPESLGRAVARNVYGGMSR
jgi:hypothetical protein